MTAPAAAVLLSVATSALTAQSALSQDCSDNAVTVSQEIVLCAQTEAAASRDRLNIAFAAFLDGLGSQTPPDLRAALSESQRLWVDFADRTCSAEGIFYAGGTLREAFVARCWAKLSAERHAYILELSSRPKG